MHQTLNYTNETDFLNFFTPWNNKTHNLSEYVFRGHGDSNYKLIPSAFRNIPNGYINSYEQARKEYRDLKSFYHLADRHGLYVPSSQIIRDELIYDGDYFWANYANKDIVWLPDELLEVAALAQHHGIKTRLLDWSYDRFVAIYFALSSAEEIIGTENVCSHSEKKISVWCLNKNSFYLDEIFEKTPIRFVTPHYYKNSNITSQHGVFTHFKEHIVTNVSDILHVETLNELLDSYFEGGNINNNLWRDNKILTEVTLPYDKILPALKLISEMGYSESKIYPGYDGICRQIMKI